MNNAVSSMMRASRIGSAIALACAIPAAAQTPPVQPDGTLTVEHLSVPVSDQMSPESRAYLRHVLVDHPFAGGPSAEKDIKGFRAHHDDIMRTFLKPMRARYAVDVKQRIIGGVLADVVTPAAGVAPREAARVLINVHGGGFTSGARTAALVEAIPIAATMGIEVISVDYRMFPEYRFPAGSEDLAAVYRKVLETHRPDRVGIYGCSAGGVLAAQSIGWFQAHGLPRPGAIGVLCAPLGKFVGGDAAYVVGPLNGFPAPSASAGPMRMTFGYMAKAADTDPLAYPLACPALLASFPPTIFVTGSRSMEFSTVVTSHNALAKAGVETELHVWDGQIHAFIYNSELPESREAYAAIGRFFDRHLAR